MPMLLVSSNAPECGKTTAATLLSGLVPRPVMVSNLTPAVLFRLIDRYQPTLIADEVDSWLHDEQSELRGVFNAAHWRTGAVIPRCVGDDHDVRLFNVFGAKVIAMIGRPSATILSRSITITLHRKTAGERVEPLRDDRLRAELGPLRQQWRRWALDHLEALRGPRSEDAGGPARQPGVGQLATPAVHRRPGRWLMARTGPSGGNRAVGRPRVRGRARQCRAPDRRADGVS